jgi:hypothetical protein
MPPIHKSEGKIRAKVQQSLGFSFRIFGTVDADSEFTSLNPGRW